MAENKPFNGIEHVTIAAKDPQTLARWYCDTLGFRVVYESTTSTTRIVKLGDSLLEIVAGPDVKSTSDSSKAMGLSHIAISVSDIQEAFDDLKKKRISFETEPSEKKGVWTAFFKDAENNQLHLIQRDDRL